MILVYGIWHARYKVANEKKTAVSKEVVKDMKDIEMQKKKIIGSILEHYNYDMYIKTVNALKYLSHPPKTRDEFKQIAKEYETSLKKISFDYAKSIENEDTKERNNSLAEIYRCSLYRDRKPPKKVIDYFFDRYKSVKGLRDIYSFEVTRIVVSTLKQNGYDAEKGFDCNSVSGELQNYSIEKLEALNESIGCMPEDFEAEIADNCPTSIELWEEYTTNLSDAALLFFYNNFDTLNEYIGDLRGIIDGIFHFEADDFRNIINELKHKKAHAKDSRLFKHFSECEFDNNVHLTNKDREKMLESLKSYIEKVPDYRDLDSFVSLCFKMRYNYQLVWETILVILKHYGNKPAGKRVNDLFDHYYKKKATISVAQIDQSLFRP